jgi:hypothetical protein
MNIALLIKNIFLSLLLLLKKKKKIQIQITNYAILFFNREKLFILLEKYNVFNKNIDRTKDPTSNQNSTIPTNENYYPVRNL